MMSDFERKIVFGNAVQDGFERRGWFVGAFVDSQKGILSNEDVEVKWGIHPKGEKRSSKAGDGNATSLTILIRGKMGVFFEGREEMILENEGDYIMWSPNIPHSTVTYEDATLVTVRWPSLSKETN